jgi:hypothetical protein
MAMRAPSTSPYLRGRIERSLADIAEVARTRLVKLTAAAGGQENAGNAGGNINSDEAAALQASDKDWVGDSR